MEKASWCRLVANSESLVPLGVESHTQVYSTGIQDLNPFRTAAHFLQYCQSFPLFNDYASYLTKILNISLGVSIQLIPY